MRQQLPPDNFPLNIWELSIAWATLINRQESCLYFLKNDDSPEMQSNQGQTFMKSRSPGAFLLHLTICNVLERKTVSREVAHIFRISFSFQVWVWDLSSTSPGIE